MTATINISLEPRVTLNMPLAEAREVTTAALKEEGFGVLTSIDVQATLKEKLGETVDPYVILGACNPQLAHRALSTHGDIGLMLPCNVTLAETDGQTTVSIVDPGTMLAAAGGHPEVDAVAREASDRLSRVLQALVS